MHTKSTIPEEEKARKEGSKEMNGVMARAAAGFFAASSLLSLFTSPNVGKAPDAPAVALMEEVNRVVSSLTTETASEPLLRGIGEHYHVVGELTHVVREGDNIASIIQRYKRAGVWTRPDQIKLRNSVSDTDTLQPGQKIVVPVLHWEPQLVAASWYGPGFHGKKTANGERYDQYAFTVAHPHLPLGIRVKLTNPETGESVIARVNDRGAFEWKYDRGIDVSFAVAQKLGVYEPGVTELLVEPLQEDEALFALAQGK